MNWKKQLSWLHPGTRVVILPKGEVNPYFNHLNGLRWMMTRITSVKQSGDNYEYHFAVTKKRVIWTKDYIL